MTLETFLQSYDALEGGLRFALQGSRQVLLVRAQDLHNAFGESTLKAAKQAFLTMDLPALKKLKEVFSCLVSKADGGGLTQVDPKFDT